MIDPTISRHSMSPEPSATPAHPPAPLIVRPESEHDADALRALHRAAFGGEVESRLVDDLRAAGDVRLSLVAEEAGRIVGHILFSELSIISAEGETLAGLALAPLAVHRDRQRQGIGSRLVAEGLALCRQQGWGPVIVLGEPAYYGRFGFTAPAARHLQSPWAGDYFLALDLRGSNSSFCGEVRYAAAFADL
jgi:putative acetyltransferase